MNQRDEVRIKRGEGKGGQWKRKRNEQMRGEEREGEGRGKVERGEERMRGWKTVEPTET